VTGKPRVLTTSVGTNTGAFSVRDWGLFWGIGLIWGSSFLFIDVGLEAFQPGLITWLRVVLGAAVLLVFPRARRRIEREDIPRLVVLSFVWVGIPFTLFPIAQQWINSAVTGMLNGAMPIFAAAISALMLARLPRGAQLLGLVVGMGGVVAISLPSMGKGETEALGVVLVIAATLCYGLAVNIAAPIQQRYGSIPVMARMLALAAVWTAPYGLYGLPDSSFAWLPGLAVGAAGVLGTGLAFVVMGTLVGSVGSTRASFITYIIPVVALALGVAFRGDRVTAVAVVGVIAVIVGAFLASRRENLPPSAAPDTSALNRPTGT